MKIHYERVGQGKHTLFLMPGALGYGYSRPPKRNFSGNFYFNDAIIASKLMKGVMSNWAVQKLGCYKYSVLGWSDGGITGLILAALDPQAVQHLVIWGASAYIAPSDAISMTAIKDVSQWSAKMRAPFEAIYGEDFSSLWHDYVEAISHNFKEEDNRICTEVLADIRCPTLILHGDKDPLVDSEHPAYLHKHIKNSTPVKLVQGQCIGIILCRPRQQSLQSKMI
ncbi:BPHL [Cordylochernes scorpioides]|uniref:BPHL n=1 Tax=Cordylochernes scorpioides TaxID=51811 RepID=A0ABY6JXG4_9ARAC|nr:BPHL [Cordylochernes scorpioides]